MKSKKLYLQILILIVLIGVGIISLTNSVGDSASTSLGASAGEAVDSGVEELLPPTNLEVYIE